ncbi:hypothetical protein HMPREF0556_12141 [Listeria grayi DSM 20601]|uniref:Uncharacterized protein n=1 Tax=Listeria grayi DSM 20601 TaxID=525367 RepID=D7UYN9_LISGR|nr:hypothetical protein HMPREF0556_12141 [Listeria grayi DSM 20601]
MDKLFWMFYTKLVNKRNDIMHAGKAYFFKPIGTFIVTQGH